MVDLNNFDASTVEPAVGFEAIPEGSYLAIIENSEMKPTKSGTGKFLELEFQIIEGPCKGRKLWTRLYLHNQSETAVNIARAELSAICRALGVMQPKNSTALHNLPLTIKVAQVKRADNGDMTNIIKGYYPKGDSQVEPVAPTTTGNPPWLK